MMKVYSMSNCPETTEAMISMTHIEGIHPITEMKPISNDEKAALLEKYTGAHLWAYDGISVVCFDPWTPCTTILAYVKDHDFSDARARGILFNLSDALGVSASDDCESLESYCEETLRLCEEALAK